MSQKRLLALVGVVAIIASACGGTTTTPQASAPASQEPGQSAPASVEPTAALAAEQILRTDIGGEPPTLDPTVAQDSNSLVVLRSLHRGLLYLDKDLNFTPYLAESYEVSPDGKTWTFKLRDAKYSNGDTIVAGDLVYSWRRLIDPRTAAPYAYTMCEVAGAAEVMGVEGGCGNFDFTQPTEPAAIDAALDKLGISAPDDKTFIVKLAVPATYFGFVTGLWVAVPLQESWITSANATEAANYVSSGPFVLDTWEHNSEIILKPNPNWYGDVKPTLTEIHMSMSPEPAQAMAAYEAGDLDLLLPVPNEDIERLRTDPVLGPEFSEESDTGIVYYNFNNGYEVARCTDEKACPTMNKNFRIALTQAIDKTAFRDATFAGLGQPATSMIQPGIPGHDASYEPYPYDEAAAKASMDKALQEIGVASAADLGKLKFGFNSGSGHEPRVAFLAEAWRRQFGLETEQIGSDFGVFLTQRTAGEYDIARNTWGADYPHGSNQLNGLFTCGGGNNDQQYCNKDFDALVNQAALEKDPDKQNDLYKQAQKIMVDDAASLFLLWRLQGQLLKPWVGGIQRTPLDSTIPGEHFTETMYIAEH